MYDYFHRTELDETFYTEHLQPRLPREMIDAHAHFNLPEHVSHITKETIAGDWALECGLLMSYEDACAYYRTFFPDIVVYMDGSSLAVTRGKYHRQQQLYLPHFQVPASAWTDDHTS